MPDHAKSSDQLPEEAPAPQVPDDVSSAKEGAARESALRQVRGFERLQEEEAGVEAGEIGGRPGDVGDTSGDGQVGEAQRPVVEAGGGEAEGFEQAESVLIEHASHGDQQSAHAVLHDQGRAEEPVDGRENGEADHEHTSERPGDERG